MPLVMTGVASATIVTHQPQLQFEVYFRYTWVLGSSDGKVAYHQLPHNLTTPAFAGQGAWRQQT
jgi:hypothetical protein